MAFEGEPQQRKSQHHLKDQEGHVCLRRFHGFFDLHVNEVVHGPVTFSPTDVQGKVTQDVITVNRVTNLRVELDSVDFSCLDFQSMQMDSQQKYQCG